VDLQQLLTISAVIMIGMAFFLIIQGPQLSPTTLVPIIGMMVFLLRKVELQLSPTIPVIIIGFMVFTLLTLIRILYPTIVITATEREIST
jgi:hypothetical protein